MKLDNKSVYDTKALRAILVRVHRNLAKHEGRLPTWEYLKVHVYTGRSRYGWTHGRASLGGGWMKLMIPTEKQRDITQPLGPGVRIRWMKAPIETRRVAWLMYHELLHNYGFHHHQYGEARDEDLDAICKGLPLTIAFKVKVRKEIDHVARREAKAREMLLVWERRQKTAQRKVREYRQKVRYYDKKQAIAAGGEHGEEA